MAREPATGPAGPYVQVAGREMPVLDVQRLAGNRAASIAVGEASTPTVQRRPNDGETTYATGDNDNPEVPPGAPKPRKMTGYLGMNPGANKELTKLKKAAGNENVLSTLGDAKLETLLQDEPAIYDFVFDDLKIPMGKVDRWSKAVDALLAVSPRARDTIGELMRWMNSAETGQIVLDRLVLSGHSNGVELWGTPESPHAPQKPGTIIIEQDLKNVADAFPAAAGQVRSVMFSACETVAGVDSVIKAFPNLDSVWAYAGFSPSIDQGSGEHIGTWQAATAGGGTPTKKDARGATAIWTRRDKWIVHDPGAGNYDTMYAQAMSLYAGPVRNVLRGSKGINQAELNEYYLKIQEVFVHPRAPAEKKAEAKKAMQVILRLRHWEKIQQKFAEINAPKLVDAYRTAGLQMPNFATITRAQLFQHMKDITKRTREAKVDQNAVDKIDEFVFHGLFELENDKAIPVEWNE